MSIQSLFTCYHGDVYRWINISGGLMEIWQDLRQRFISKRQLEGELRCLVCGHMYKYLQLHKLSFAESWHVGILVGECMATSCLSICQ